MTALIHKQNAFLHRIKAISVINLDSLDGVFENKDVWIQRAMARAIERIKVHGVALDIRIVHYGTNFDQGYKELEALGTAAASQCEQGGDPL